MSARRERLLWITVLTATSWLLVLAPASAYIDPGNVSFFFASIVAAVAAAAMVIRGYWNRLTSVFRRKSKDTVGTSEDA